MVNVELLKKLYDWAVASQKNLDKFFEDNPNWARHEQGSWGHVVKNGVCQTAFCLAGQVAVNNGYTFIIADDDWETNRHGRRETTGAVMVPTAKVHDLGLKFVKGTRRTFAHGNHNALNGVYGPGIHTYAPTVAEKVLGISENEAGALFDGSNDLYDIARFINEIFENHGLPNRVGLDA